MSRLADMKHRAIGRMYSQIEEAELMCRIGEAAHGVPRPAGLTAAEVCDVMDPQSREWLRSMARAALAYMVECLNVSEQPS